jgi:ribosome recycling factor
MSEGIEIKEIKRRMDGAVSAFKSDIASLRTGRASANILDPVTVEAYGARMPLNQVANITVPESRMLSVSVWDKSMVSAVERSIREANLGLNPIVDGQNLRIPLPELNEERRRSLVKVAHDYAEKGCNSPRSPRRYGRP